MRRSDRGVVAVEFALILPTMLLFVIGVFDISKAMILYQEVYNSAHTIPLSASILAVQADKSTSLTPTQVQQSMSAIFAEIPWLRSGMENGNHSVTMSSVTFQQTVPTCVGTQAAPCAFTPYITWSVPYADPAGRYPGNANTFLAVTRPCGQAKQTTPTAGVSGDLTSLRTASVVNPDPILVVDVHYRYTPLFFTFITGPVDFWASGYWPVRSVAPNTPAAQQYTKYDILNTNGGAGKCAGFS